MTAPTRTLDDCARDLALACARYAFVAAQKHGTTDLVASAAHVAGGKLLWHPRVTAHALAVAKGQSEIARVLAERAPIDHIFVVAPWDGRTPSARAVRVVSSN